MLFHPRSIAPPLLFLLMLLMLCTCDRSPTTQFSSRGDTPDPMPTDTESFLAQSSRYLNQSQFLSIRPGHFWFDGGLGPIAAATKGEERVIQEADLYALGAPGEDLVYVLNPYRGLQVLSFREGLGQKALVGRVAASPYPSIEMYRPLSQPLLLILERKDTDLNGHWLPDSATRLAIYDLHHARAPRFLEAIEIPGEYADSRLVGNILYVATSRTHYRDNTWEAKAQLRAFALSPEGLQMVDEYVSPLPLRSRDSLQVIQSKTEQITKTYAILTLQAELWGAWNRESTLELVDLSDAAGKIQPVLRVTTQGQVRERSAAFLHRDALVAVSNSWVPQGEQMIRQVSVESFTLPLPGAHILTVDEGKARQSWIKQQIAAHRGDANSLATLRDKLANDPQRGLKGLFVQTLDGKTLEKFLPDALVETRDDTGLHADIQDVRLNGDQLYVFWVPANQVDPLDIFDLREVPQTLSYKGRTLFPGWVERAFPISYQKQNYILALGWIRPDGEDPWQRKAQAILFAISDQGQAKVLSQLTLSGDSLWSYFNDQDKKISWLPTDAGSGRILFPMQAGGLEPRQGAKLVHYQLDPPLLQEGPTLAANPDGWLQRVLANPQLHRYQVLSDRSFDSFASEVYQAWSQATVVTPESSIELARDIVAYVPLENLGLQVIQKAASWRLTEGVELRLTAQADAELSSLLDRRNIQGAYVSSHALNQKTLALLTQEYGRDRAGSTWHLNLVSLLEGKKLKIQTMTWNAAEDSSLPLPKFAYGYPHRSSVIWAQLASGETLIQLGQQIFSLRRTSQVWSFQPLSLSATCGEASQGSELMILDGRAFFLSAEPFTDDIPDRQTHRLVKVWLRSLQLTAEDTATCGPALNIPGRPLALHKNRLISEDQRIVAWKKPSWEGAEDMPLYPETRRVLISLEWKNKQASLRDLYDASSLLDPILVSPSTATLSFLSREGDEPVDTLHALRLNPEVRFEQTLWNIPSLSLPQDPWLLWKQDTPSGLPHLLAWRDGRSLRLWHVPEGRPTLEPLSLWERQADGTWLPQKVGTMPASSDWMWRDNREQLVYDSRRSSLTLAAGLWGVAEWYAPELTSSP